MLKKAISSWLFLLIYLFCGISITQTCQASTQIIPEQENNLNSSTLEVIDYWTQHFFDLLRPELQGREIQRYETIYQREKAAIAQIVNHILLSTCQQQHRNYYFFLTDQKIDNDSARYPRSQYPQRGANSNLYNREKKTRFSHNNQRRFILEKEYIWEDNFYWRQNKNYFFEGFYQDLTDAIFYARHPEISLKEEKSQHFNLATEWNLIRRHFANYDQEEFLKKYLIPICKDL